ncbi:hypothetical protein D8S93_18800 [Vibrio sp. VGrn 2]|nr:hypothetical protein [Vibrio sp. VGrn 2]
MGGLVPRRRSATPYPCGAVFVETNTNRKKSPKKISKANLRTPRKQKPKKATQLPLDSPSTN